MIVSPEAGNPAKTARLLRRQVTTGRFSVHVDVHPALDMTEIATQSRQATRSRYVGDTSVDRVKALPSPNTFPDCSYLGRSPKAIRVAVHTTEHVLCQNGERAEKAPPLMMLVLMIRGHDMTRLTDNCPGQRPHTRGRVSRRRRVLRAAPSQMGKCAAVAVGLHGSSTCWRMPRVSKATVALHNVVTCAVPAEVVPTAGTARCGYDVAAFYDLLGAK